MITYDNEIKIKTLIDEAESQGNYAFVCGRIKSYLMGIPINCIAYPAICKRREEILESKLPISIEEFEDYLDMVYDWGDMPTGIQRHICYINWRD